MNISLKRQKMPMTKEARTRFWKTNVTGWTMIAGPFVGFLCFTAIPMFYGLYISFFYMNSTLLDSRVFIGLKNYVSIFKNEMFYQGLGNTLYYSLSVLLNMGLSLFLAQQLTGHEIFGHKIWRIVLFLPQVCSMVAVTVMWSWILNVDYGIINQILTPIGLKFEPTTRGAHFMPSVFLMGLWRDGVNVILLQSSLVNVNKSLQEAARLDGANELQVFWKITFQAILPTLFYMLITNLIVATQEMGLFQILTNGGYGPERAGLTVAHLISIMTNSQHIQTMGYGMSSALSWIFAVILVIVTRILMWLNNKYVCYD